MTEQELAEVKQGIGGLSPEGSAWKAVISLLRDDVEIAIGSACIPNLNDSERQFNAGRMSHAIDILHVFESTMKEIQRIRHEQD